MSTVIRLAAKNGRSSFVGPSITTSSNANLPDVRNAEMRPMCIGRLRNLVAWLSATVRSDRPATEMLPMSTVKTVIRIDARIAETTNAARRVQRRAAARLTPRTLEGPGVGEGSETAGVLASLLSGESTPAAGS
jgi:hypothetical protein